MTYVISRNYRDRDSQYKWLIRTSDQAPEQARACRRVETGSFQFCPSNKSERGWGCTVVAVTDTAVGYGYEDEENGNVEGLRELEFHFNSFSTKDDHHTVDGAAKLVLTETGQMFSS